MKAFILSFALAAVPSALVAQAPAPRNAADFVAKAGASDLYEIQSSQLALQRSRDDSVRGFAQMMIDHHGMTTQQVTQAVRTAGLTPPPPKLEPQQAQMIAQLQPLSGEAFDKAYVDQQKMAHQQALALHSGYAQSGDSAPLKQAAAAAVPIVQQHLTTLQSLPTQ